MKQPGKLTDAAIRSAKVAGEPYNLQMEEKQAIIALPFDGIVHKIFEINRLWSCCTVVGCPDEDACGLVFAHYKRRDSKAVMQRIANPLRSVRLRLAPPIFTCMRGCPAFQDFCCDCGADFRRNGVAVSGR